MQGLLVPSLIQFENDPDTDMKLRDDDKDWLQGEISAQITEAISALKDLLRPHGARRVGIWLRDWGLVAAAVATPLTLLGLLITVSIFAASGLTKNAEFRTRTDDRLAVIEKDVGTIRDTVEKLAPLLKEVAARRIKEAGSQTPQQLSSELPDLKSLAVAARSADLKVQPQAVEEVGTKLIAIGSADAWDTAIDFLNYKSFLNASLTVKYREVGTPGETVYTEYRPIPVPGIRVPQFGVLGAVPSEEAARFLRIGDPNPNSNRGNDWIIAEGGALIIDHMRLKKVIFRNVYISYSGGPLEMENVYFLNCTFGVKQQPNGQGLVAAILKPPPATTFTAS